MSRDILSYPVNFDYGAKSGSYTHRGRDRAAPRGVPVIIGTTKIGEVGSTGYSTGNHLHTQSGRDELVQSTVHPKNHEFKPGVVVRTGEASQWGKYVIVKGVDGYHTCYAHLSRITARKGQKVGVMGVSRTDLDAIYQHGPLGRKRGSREGEDVYLGKTAAFVLNDHYKSGEAKRKREAEAAQKKLIDQLKKLNQELKAENKLKKADLETYAERVDGLTKELLAERQAHEEAKKSDISGVLSRLFKVIKDAWNKS